MFASHGENKTASCNVGDRKYSMSGNAKAGESSIQLKNGGVEEVFKKYSNLDIKGTVLLQACFAGGTHNKGQDMIKSIAAWSQTPVMASQAWGNAYSSMNEKGFFFDNYDNSHGQSLSIPKGASNFWRHSQDYTDAISNLGKSSLAYPTGDGNANVISIQGTFYYNTDGTYGIIKRSEVLSKISKDQTTFYKNPRAYGWAN
jgi:phage-related tail fiber protein